MRNIWNKFTLPTEFAAARASRLCKLWFLVFAQQQFVWGLLLSLCHFPPPSVLLILFQPWSGSRSGSSWYLIRRDALTALFWPSPAAVLLSFQTMPPGWCCRVRRTTSTPATSRWTHRSCEIVSVCVSIEVRPVYVLRLCVSQVAPPSSGVCLRYIAAQGPLPQTCTHFWQSVWEQQIHTVIMLTTLTERGRVYHTFFIKQPVYKEQIGRLLKWHISISVIPAGWQLITCCVMFNLKRDYSNYRVQWWCLHTTVIRWPSCE